MRLHRRICLLRAGGQAEAAGQLEQTELAAALESIRASGDSASVAPLLAAEEARVAEAVTLAEVLAPLLARQLAALPGQASHPGPGRLGPLRRNPLMPGRLPGQPAPSVADFIDGMLAQDRAGPPN